MFQVMCLLLVVSAASPLKTPLHGVHDAKYEALRDFARKEITGPFADILVNIILDQGTVIKDMENKINSLTDQESAIKDLEKKVNALVDKGSTTKALESKVLEQGSSLNVLEKKVNSLEQGKTIKTLEEKVNMLTELVDKQEGQIMMMQGQINDLETFVQKQNHDLDKEKDQNEKDMLNESIMNQRSKMDKNMKGIIGTFQKEEGETQKNVKNGNAIRTNIFPSHMTLNGIMKSYKHNNIAVKNGDSNSDLGENGVMDKVSGNRCGEVLQAKIGHYPSAHGSGRDSVQKRTATHVAFSTYLSHTLDHLSIGHVIKLDQVFLNDGNGYNAHTGIFTVPASGVYLLTYSIKNNHKTHHLEIELLVDNNHMGTLKAYAYEQVTSKTIITRLTTGQSVWLENAFFPDASISATGWNKFTTFSGVLLY